MSTDDSTDLYFGTVNRTSVSADCIWQHDPPWGAPDWPLPDGRVQALPVAAALRGGGVVVGHVLLLVLLDGGAARWGGGDQLLGGKQLCSHYLTVRLQAGSWQIRDRTEVLLPRLMGVSPAAESVEHCRQKYCIFRHMKSQTLFKICWFLRSC